MVDSPVATTLLVSFTPLSGVMTLTVPGPSVGVDSPVHEDEEFVYSGFGVGTMVPGNGVGRTKLVALTWMLAVPFPATAVVELQVDAVLFGKEVEFVPTVGVAGGTKHVEVRLCDTQTDVIGMGRIVPVGVPWVESVVEVGHHQCEVVRHGSTGAGWV